MQLMQNRRQFLTTLSLAGAAGILGNRQLDSAEAEPPPETTTIRLPKIPAACTAPLYLSEELLHEEGFSEVRYVPTNIVSVDMLAADVDFSMEAGVDYLPLMDAGRALTVLAGIQVGCFELVANESIQGIPDLRGKRVGIAAIGSTDHLLVSTMAAYVGLNPAEIDWVADATVSQTENFIAGKIDAFIGAPPDPQQSCMQNVGHVIVNTGTDPPWSNYFCCMLIANADFVRSNPMATKRAVRAILRATDICHAEPERAARRMGEIGFSHECALMMLKEVRYGIWREYDPEDSVRFFALRLHELGMIRKAPSEIIAEFTDWRFLSQVKSELSKL